MDFWESLSYHLECHTLKCSFHEEGDHFGSASSDSNSLFP